MSAIHVMEGVVGLQRVHIPHFQVSKSGFSDFGEFGFVLRYFGLQFRARLIDAHLHGSGLQGVGVGFRIFSPSHLARTSLPCRVCSETVALAQ